MLISSLAKIQSLQKMSSFYFFIIGIKIYAKYLSSSTSASQDDFSFRILISSSGFEKFVRVGILFRGAERTDVVDGVF